MVRRTDSAPIIPETFFYGSAERGSCTSARIIFNDSDARTGEQEVQKASVCLVEMFLDLQSCSDKT